MTWLRVLAALASLLLLAPTAAAEGPRKVEAPQKEAEAEAEAPPVAAEQTGADGEKTYEFQAVEVEGRLKGPQILYFLRRVRAELRAGRLGHRSFLPELTDTRRSRVLR